MSLSPAQLRVIRLLAHGKTVQDIADELFLSHNTVKTHLFNARRATGSVTRDDLVDWATVRGLL